MQLVVGVSALYPDHLVAKGNRMIDDAFATVCDMLADLSVAVRTQASTLLGDMVGVSEDYLMQTFDKTVMSHLRKKKTEHELMKEKARGATGSNKLPGFSDLDVNQVRMMSHGVRLYFNVLFPLEVWWLVCDLWCRASCPLTHLRVWHGVTGGWHARTCTCLRLRTPLAVGPKLITRCR
jgi:hypothetical protein